MDNFFMLFFYSALKDASLFKSTKKKKLSHLFMILKVVKLQTTIVGNY